MTTEKSSITDKPTSDFTNILISLKNKFEVISCSWSEEKSFEIKFRTEMDSNTHDYNKLCDQWVDRFSNMTDTVWAKKTSNTGPKVKFRKQYQCWTHGGKEIKKELLFDARKCKGTVDIKFLSDTNPTSKRKNKFLRLGLNVVVKINFFHLHKVNTSDEYAFFVHNCAPQTETPKRAIIVNERLPQIVSEMIQKRLKATTPLEGQEMNVMNPNDATEPQVVNDMRFEELKPMEETDSRSIELCSSTPDVTIERNDLIQETIGMNSIPTFQNIIHIPIHNMKFDYQPGLEQYAHIIVSDSNIDEPLVCQPLLFDNLQSLPHFVQLNSHSLCSENHSEFLQ